MKAEELKTEKTKREETKETESNKMGVAKSMHYLLKTIWRADKGCVIYAFYKNCTEEIFGSFFYILLLQMIYSYIESVSSFRKLVIFVGGFCLGHICIHLASAGYAYYIRLKTPKVYAHIFHHVIEKAGKIGLTQFEKPDFYDKYAKALDECLSKAMDGLASLTWAIGCALSAIAAMALIARVDPVMLCFSVPPNM